MGPLKLIEYALLNAIGENVFPETPLVGKIYDHGWLVWGLRTCRLQPGDDLMATPGFGHRLGWSTPARPAPRRATGARSSDARTDVRIKLAAFNSQQPQARPEALLGEQPLTGIHLAQVVELPL